MSSSKSKMRCASKMEESVDIHKGPTEHQPHAAHIEIQEEEEASEKATQTKTTGKQVARKSTQRAEVGIILRKSKRMEKEWPVSPSIVVLFIRLTLLRMEQRT